jgi:hypothetical protein
MMRSEGDGGRAILELAVARQKMTEGTTASLDDVTVTRQMSSW